MAMETFSFQPVPACTWVLFPTCLHSPSYHASLPFAPTYPILHPPYFPSNTASLALVAPPSLSPACPLPPFRPPGLPSLTPTTSVVDLVVTRARRLRHRWP